VLDLSLSSDQDATKNVSVGILTESTDITVRKDEGSRIKIKASGKKSVPWSPELASCRPVTDVRARPPKTPAQRYPPAKLQV
jgi:hypothetical protein